MRKNFKLERWFISDLFYKGYIAAVTEGPNQSDIFGIRKSLFAIEFEIKTSRSDFMNEINLINKILNNEHNSKLFYRMNNKYHKHNSYLGRPSSFAEFDFRPNEFYFVIPEELMEIAKKEINRMSSPYGLITFGIEKFTDYVGFSYIIRAKKLHENKISNDSLLYILRKATTECQELRKRLISRNE